VNTGADLAGGEAAVAEHVHEADVFLLRNNAAFVWGCASGSIMARRVMFSLGYFFRHQFVPGYEL
jgi:hypothetical protein